MSFDKTMWVRDLVHGVTSWRVISAHDPEYPTHSSTLACGGSVFSAPDDKPEMVTCVKCIVAERLYIYLQGVSE
jgi:hypothetical protein